jgi:hypothetical protein
MELAKIMQTTKASKYHPIRCKRKETCNNNYYKNEAKK